MVTRQLAHDAEGIRQPILEAEGPRHLVDEDEGKRQPVPRLSVPDFVLQLWRKIGEPGRISHVIQWHRDVAIYLTLRYTSHGMFVLLPTV